MVWDKLANKYDQMWVQKYSLYPTRKAILSYLEELELPSKLNLLDLGCGTGQLIDEILKSYPQFSCVGVDQSEQMLQLAMQKKNKAEFISSYAENFPQNIDRTFQLITCCHSFPYYENKKKVLNNIVMTLDDGGYVIFIQATINTNYDKVVMYFVQKQTEKANYFSGSDFKLLFQDFPLRLVREFLIKEKFYMPSISGFIFQKQIK